MIGETLQAGFAASTEAVRPGGLDLERSVSVVTLLGAGGAAVVAVGKAIYWILGRFFSDPLRAEIKLLRDDMNRRWDTHDERAQDLIDRVHDLEAGCATRHERLTRHERS